MLISIVALPLLLPEAHSLPNACGNVCASGNLQVENFSIDSITWSLSVSANGDWRNKTLLADTDSFGEQHLHLFDTNPVYDTASNTTRFDDLAKDHLSSKNSFPNEVWYVNLYFAINVSIQNFFNGQQHILPLPTLNYVGNYSTNFLYCTPSSLSTGQCYKNFGLPLVKDPFDLPGGYHFPWIYNTTVFIWRNPDVVQQLGTATTLATVFDLFAGALILLALSQLALLMISVKNKRYLQYRLLDSSFFTLAGGILFFVPIYILSLNPIISPILSSPLHDQLSTILLETTGIVLFGFAVFLFRRVWSEHLGLPGQSVPSHTGRP